ncbi:hypothetical protein HYC85_025487 [Camellia sinensis]|uniref:non-specific serine/threonine protein kinase n=1 Tax=Camellia sinensis TaxID=4442 RepID=A0A7J7GDF9_CAMSI|nr:hypothetical protein HYC85_025487 [Camellia sinensis]
MSCSSSSGSEEEDEGIDSYRKGGYHAVRVGDSFSGGRYIAQRKLGWGQFSTVWLAYDIQFSRYVALKIQKSAPQFAQAALHEIEVLSAIADGNPSNNKCVVQLVDHFKHTGPNGQHLCMVLEFLGDSLLRLIKYSHYKGLELNKVREICKCILNALDYLHRELGIIHTDLKPENILLISTIDPNKDPIRSGLTPILERPEGNPNGGATMNIVEKQLKRRARKAVARIGRRASMGGVGGSTKVERCLDGIDMRCKVVDFGNACWADKQFAEEIQTRQYRAPEVILCSGYSSSVDMWSFACTAFELATGEMMFTPKSGQGFSDDEDHLALMMELLGKMPRKIAVGGARSKDYFDRHGDLKRIRRLKYWPLDRLLVDKFKFSDNDAREFSEFLCPLLDFAPENRPTAQQCLQHPWLNIRNSTKNEVKSESSLQKVDVGMSNLKIKVGK